MILALTLSAKTCNTLSADYSARLDALSLSLTRTSARACGTLTGDAAAFPKLINTLNRDINGAICRRAVRIAERLTLAADEIGQALPLDDEPTPSVCEVVAEAPAAELPAPAPVVEVEAPAPVSAEVVQVEAPAPVSVEVVEAPHTTETETPSNEVLDSLFSIEHGDPRTGAGILEQYEDTYTTLRALKVALNEGVCDEQNTARVTLVRRVTFYTEEARKEARRAAWALAILENKHPAVYAFINQIMSEAHSYLWAHRLDLAHESLLSLDVLEGQGYAPPKGYTWCEAFEAIDDAWDKAHGY
jgi:hypothetical protein